MIHKPTFRSEKYASTFEDASVFQVYDRRPPYPEEPFSRMAELVDPDVDAMLDVGTGLGNMARPAPPCSLD